MKKYPKIFLLALGVIVLDQITKSLAKAALSKPVSLLPFLELKFTTNTGAAFSLFQNYPDLLMWLSIIIIGLILYFLDKIVEEIDGIALGLVLGGAIGNLIDRILFGRVSDFIAFSFWPTFNVADSCIFIGAAIVILQSFRDSLRKKEQKK